MTEIDEVPGAIERPAGCNVRIVERDGVTLVEIPSRGASPVMWIAACMLALVLLGWIIMGTVLIVAGKPILVIAGIANHGLTPAMLRYRFWFTPVALAVFVFGSHELLGVLRPKLSRETLVFGPVSVRHIGRFLRWRADREFPYEIVRSFTVRHDPHGMSHGTLKLVCRGEECEIAEFVSNADREWLASVGNTLVRKRLR